MVCLPLLVLEFLRDFSQSWWIDQLENVCYFLLWNRRDKRSLTKIKAEKEKNRNIFLLCFYLIIFNSSSRFSNNSLVFLRGRKWLKYEFSGKNRPIILCLSSNPYEIQFHNIDHPKSIFLQTNFNFGIGFFRTFLECRILYHHVSHN